MPANEIERVAVIGTGTIGMSWAALFLARGLRVSASDPEPEAEARLRRFVADAWPVLMRLGAVAAGDRNIAAQEIERDRFLVELLALKKFASDKK